MGELYRLRGAYRHALVCYQYCLGLSLELDDRMMVAVSCENIAQVNIEEGQYDSAARLLAKAITLAQVLNIPYFLSAELYSRAEVLAAQRADHAAQAANEQALRVAEQVERRDVLLKAQLLALDLRARLEPAEQAAAAAECGALLEQWAAASEQAAILYQRWKIGGHAADRARASELYREVYTQTPNTEYRRRLHELTGERPPDPPALPPPPPIMAQKRMRFEALLDRVDTVVAASSAPDVSRRAVGE
jgi:tetratricopeptide (TPR) repeat protein